MRFADSLVAAVKKSNKDADFALVSDDTEILSEVTEWIPTGFECLDTIFGNGLPVGRCSEGQGEEGSGKSAFAQMACVQTQKLGGLVVYIDFEHALDPEKMVKLGINPAGLLYLSPDYIEQAWDVVWTLIDKLIANPPPAPTLFVWDSVGGSLAKSQFEGSAEDANVGAVARAMTPNCAKLFKKIAKCRAHFLFVNQQRMSIGGFSKFGPPPKKTPGGEALRYAATLRMSFKKVATLKDKAGMAIGYLVKTKTEKNRLVPPHRSATWCLDFGVGPSPDLTVYEILKDAGKFVAIPRTETYTVRGFKGEPVTRSTWIARFQGDSVLREHALGMYREIVQQGLSGARVAADTSAAD